MVSSYSLGSMIKGWFIGPFDPSVFKTDQFECAVKKYAAGEREAAHVHRVAREFTVVVNGRARMNGTIYESGTIVEMPPGEATDFEALTDVLTFVVKVPAVLGDKYPVP